MYWLIPANPKYYNYFKEFKDNGFIDWHQIGKYSIGDVVYIYSGKPYKKITFKTVVEEVNILKDDAFDDEIYHYESSPLKTYQKYIRLRVVSSYTTDRLSLYNLQQHGLKKAPQGKIGLKDDILEYILNESKLN